MHFETPSACFSPARRQVLSLSESCGATSRCYSRLPLFSAFSRGGLDADDQPVGHSRMRRRRLAAVAAGLRDERYGTREAIGCLKSPPACGRRRRLVRRSVARAARMGPVLPLLSLATVLSSWTPAASCRPRGCGHAGCRHTAAEDNVL